MTTVSPDPPPVKIFIEANQWRSQPKILGGSQNVWF